MNKEMAQFAPKQFEVTCTCRADNDAKIILESLKEGEVELFIDSITGCEGHVIMKKDAALQLSKDLILAVQEKTGE